MTKNAVHTNVNFVVLICQDQKELALLSKIIVEDFREKSVIRISELLMLRCFVGKHQFENK